MDLGACFIQTKIRSNTLVLYKKHNKRNWSPVKLASEVCDLSIGQGLTLSLMEKYQMFLEKF